MKNDFRIRKPTQRYFITTTRWRGAGLRSVYSRKRPSVCVRPCEHPGHRRHLPASAVWHRRTPDASLPAKDGGLTGCRLNGDVRPIDRTGALFFLSSQTPPHSITLNIRKCAAEEKPLRRHQPTRRVEPGDGKDGESWVKDAGRAEGSGGAIKALLGWGWGWGGDVTRGRGGMGRTRFIHKDTLTFKATRTQLGSHCSTETPLCIGRIITRKGSYAR